jgi:hypothetical protein
MLPGITIVPPNGSRYWRWGGRGFCLEQEKPEARKMLENRAESRQSTARCVRRRMMLIATSYLEEV